MFFKDLFVFLLLPLLLAFFWFIQKRRRERPGILFPSEALFPSTRSSWRLVAVASLPVLRLLAALLILISLARPQKPLEEARIRKEGIDIVLTLDTSTSMLAEDFKSNGVRKNRVDIIKEVVRHFIKARPDDRIALVVFSGVANTLCPLTLDHAWLLSNLDRITPGILEDGTAIGTALMVSLNRLKDSAAKSKIIILLTDGRNNAGPVTPLTAAETARTLRVKIYTIGAGSKGPVPYPFQDIFGRVVYRPVSVDLDEETLSMIAEMTEAKYFRAPDTESLNRVYQEINRLEKVPFEEKGFKEYRELFPFFLIPALFLLLTEIILKNTWLRVLP